MSASCLYGRDWLTLPAHPVRSVSCALWVPLTLITSSQLDSSSGRWDSLFTPLTDIKREFIFFFLIISVSSQLLRITTTASVFNLTHRGWNYAIICVHFLFKSLSGCRKLLSFPPVEIEAIWLWLMKLDSNGTAFMCDSFWNIKMAILPLHLHVLQA